MPDRDIIESSLGPSWRLPYRLLKAGSPPEELVTALVQSLCATLRRGGGVPGFTQVMQVLTAVEGGRLRFMEAFDRLSEVERVAGGHRITRVACEAALGLITELQSGPPSDSDLSTRFAQECCRRWLGHFFFGAVRLQLVGSQFADVTEANRWEHECRTIADPALKSVASRISRDPTGRRLRAPARSGHLKRSTADLLAEPIAS